MDPLSQIAERYPTDKGLNHHGYTPIYNRYFESLRNQSISLVELGFGGYHYLDRGGGGALMWAEYFPQGRILTVDMHPKKSLGNPRISFHQCSQTDEASLKYALDHKLGALPDIVIDDASHISALTIRSFEILFPLLTPAGAYVVEDAHASYWNEHEFDGTTDLQDLTKVSTMNYFKLLTDGLNYEHLRECQKLMPWFSDQIESIHFYKQLIFIFKK